MGVKTSTLFLLRQDPVFHTSSFAAVSNTSHYVSANSGTITVTLPGAPANGDRVEITALGDGTDQITINDGGNNLNIGGLNIGGPFGFVGSGFHILLEFRTVDNGWTSIANDVDVYFYGPQNNSLLLSDPSGQTSAFQIADNSVVKRTGGGAIEASYYSTRNLTSTGVGGVGPFTIPSTSLSDITGLSWAIPGGGDSYCFEIALALTQSSSSGIVGVSVNITTPGTLNNFVQHANLIRSSGAITASTGTNLSPGTAVVDSSSRSAGGPFLTTINGAFHLSGGGTMTVQAQRSAGTTVVEVNSWGRVWKAQSI